MSDLERDLHYAMCESANISEAEADRILDAIMTTIKPLGYTRPGLTDAQRKAFENITSVYDRLKILPPDRTSSLEKDCLKATGVVLATFRYPEPPKPDKIVRNSDFIAGWRAGLRAANLLNITQENAEWLMPNEATLPIPGEPA